MNDGELVERFRNGDSEATRILWFHSGWLELLARQKLGADHWTEANDVVAQAYEALLRSRKPVANPRAWLTETVTHLVATRFRQLASERRSLSKLCEPDPETCALLRHTEERLAAQKLWDSILSALNERDGETLVLAYEQTKTGRTTREQARELGIAENTLSQRKLRAQRSAQAALLVMRWQSASVECMELSKELARAAQRVTPAVLEWVGLHLKRCDEPGCEQLRKEWEEPARHKFVWTLPVLLPSPAVRDRIRNVCDELRREDARSKTRARQHHPAAGPRYPQQPSRGPRHRVSTTIGACVVAGLVVGVSLNKSGSDFTGSLRELVPGIVAPSDSPPGSSDSPDGRPGGPATKGVGKGVRKGGATTHSPHSSPSPHGSRNPDDVHDNVNHKGRGTGPAAGSKGGKNDNPHTSDPGKHGGDGDGGDRRGNPDTSPSHPDDNTHANANANAVVVPPEDKTGPEVSLVRISTDAVGQVVLDHHGVRMQTCGPTGTPTTYSVRVAASDPSGLSHLTLYIQHPTDGTYVSDAGVADGDAIRFDIPAYATTPKQLKTVKLRLAAVAVDSHGNRTKVSLGKLPLYECGEPG